VESNSIRVEYYRWMQKELPDLQASALKQHKAPFY
ncbi:uncharacterized protein METZ01_LOCUS85244, partial [marine metagenome]